MLVLMRFQHANGMFFSYACVHEHEGFSARWQTSRIVF
jgi:hypothetical protein